MRITIKQLAAASTSPIALLGELSNLGREKPVGLTRGAVALLDRVTYPVIEERRRASDLDERGDILSLLLRATSEDGSPGPRQEMQVMDPDGYELMIAQIE